MNLLDCCIRRRIRSSSRSSRKAVRRYST
jgi:hypothetical protein